MFSFYTNQIKKIRIFSIPEDETKTEIVPTESIPQVSAEVESTELPTPVTSTEGVSSQRSNQRQGRQHSGDTYTLEIAFPAIKYVTSTKTKTDQNLLLL